MDELKQITTRYLLGELSEQEQAALEERYFRDPIVFSEVLQVESELVDAYARGQLSAEMRERFEQSYLKHPSRRNRVEFARALTTRIDERQAPEIRTEESPWHVSLKRRLLAIGGDRKPALRFAMVLVIVLIALAGIWIFIKSTNRQQQREAAQHGEQPASTPPQTGKEETASSVPSETSRPSPAAITSPAPRVVSLALTAGGVRSADGGATPTLVIPPDTTQAQILLDLKDDSYPHYRISLRQIGGPEIFTQTNLRPRRTKAGSRFVFTVQAKRLTSGDYALTLSGITPQGEADDLNKSFFRVEKR
jgi:hypothetical protein